MGTLTMALQGSNAPLQYVHSLYLTSGQFSTNAEMWAIIGPNNCFRYKHSYHNGTEAKMQIKCNGMTLAN